MDLSAMWLSIDESARHIVDPLSTKALILWVLSRVTFKCGLLGYWTQELELFCFIVVPLVMQCEYRWSFGLGVECRVSESPGVFDCPIMLVTAVWSICQSGVCVILMFIGCFEVSGYVSAFIAGYESRRQEVCPPRRLG